jgi:GNAT superfamily N-acetyltransferase
MLFRMDAVHACGARPAATDAYTIARLDAAMLSRSPLVAQRGRAAKFLRRLEIGYDCVGFLDGDGIVRSYVWIAGGAGRPDIVPVWRGLKWRLVGQDAYFWDCRTDPAHEGRGLYRRALIFAAAQAAGGGATRAWIETETRNQPSMRGISAAGFTPAAELDAWNILGATFWRAEKRLPRPAFAPVSISSVFSDPPPQE